MCPRFSIIIPHYNIPDLLMRCLDSIPVCEDIQVIVVDDNSLGADTYPERYPRLSRPYLDFIRTTKGGGAGYARNVGLEHATGKWLLFADADDFFAENMLEILKPKVNSEADIVFFRKKGVLSDDIHQESEKDHYLDEIMDIYLSTGDDLPIRTRHFVPWGKIIRRDLVNRHSIRFDEVKYSNDCYFSVCSGFYANTIEVSDSVLYYKTDRPGSLASDLCTKPDELRIRANVAFRIDRFLFNHDMCRERIFVPYMIQMFKTDRDAFRYYYFKLNEIYPSFSAAKEDICHYFSLKGKILFLLRTLLIQVRL